MAKQYRNQDFIDKINKRIAEIREQKGIVQEDIVDRTGFTQKQVWNILSGVNNPSVSTIEAISRALEIHPKELFDFDYHVIKQPPTRKERKGK
ncbi:MAG: helix-turn-helix domain-containing protein [Mucilaginibacter sp.]